MHLLGIESSCDDTSVALLQASPDGVFEVLRVSTESQIDVHKKYGGVIPEIAGRKHAEKIVPLIEAILTGFEKPDAIAVTAGPGLVTGLLVGVEAAKTLSYVWNVPLVRVNHIDGHVHSVLLGDDARPARPIVFPAVCLVVSGGHTELLLMRDHSSYELIGKTRDDAAGECFDKVAKLLGFEYPGGPKISLSAAGGQTDAIPFPRPMIDSPDFDFSFAGLKTAARYWLRDNNLGEHVSDFCASFEQAIVDVLVAKTIRAVEKFSPKTVLLAGGVSANVPLRETLAKEIETRLGPNAFLLSAKKYSMDNAAMIAAAGYFYALRGAYTPWRELQVNPNWHVYD